jgi:hypothetical protein
MTPAMQANQTENQPKKEDVRAMLCFVVVLYCVAPWHAACHASLCCALLWWFVVVCCALAPHATLWRARLICKLLNKFGSG